MPGRKERRKGFNAEREVVHLLEAAGIPAKRVYGSIGVDVTTAAHGYSVKRRANGMGWAYDELEREGIDRVLF